MNDAKFVVIDKSTIFYIMGHLKVPLKRTRNAAGMAEQTARAVCSSLNRLLDWVDMHGKVGLASNEASDSDYLKFKLLTLTQSLNLQVIESTVTKSIEAQLYDNRFDAKRSYFTLMMDSFAKDNRIISIIDRYTFNNVVINTECDTKQNKANLADHDLYAICMMITFARIYNLCYLTVMDIGDYMSVTSSSIVGDDRLGTTGLADIIFKYVIRNRYSENIGLYNDSFIDRIVFNFMKPHVEKKLVKDAPLMDRFGAIGVDRFSVYMRATTELLGGLHRISPAYDVGVESPDKDNYDGEEDPSSRKFYFKKVCKYLQDSLKRILNNNISNINPKFQIKSEGADDTIEKESFDSYVNDNREQYTYMMNIKKLIYMDALASVKSETLYVFDKQTIYRHDLNKFLISLYMDIRYHNSEASNLLNYAELKAIVLHIFDLLKGYDELRYSIVGQVHSQKNSINITIADFKENGTYHIPTFMCNNIQKSMKLLTSYARNQYRSEIIINGKPSVSEHAIKAELISFIKNAHTIFGVGNHEHR